MNDFFALDVETANADYSSICQIGLVKFTSGSMSDHWSFMVNPQSYFDPYNVSIHGIREEDVEGQPTFPEIFQKVEELINGMPIVHHGHFDRTAFSRCYDRFSLKPIEADWIDCTKVVRRTWSEFSQKGYGLSNLSRHFKIELDHHDALSDARASGEVFLLALNESGLAVNEWLSTIKQPITSPRTADDIRRDGDSSAPFFGEKIVFTGTLAVERKTAADVAQKLGFDVQSGVTKQTTYLCVGIQDTASLAGYSKSSKHRKAEKLASDGQEISILSEEDFWTIARVYESGEL